MVARFPKNGPKTQYAERDYLLLRLAPKMLQCLYELENLSPENKKKVDDFLAYFD